MPASLGQFANEIPCFALLDASLYRFRYSSTFGWVEAVDKVGERESCACMKRKYQPSDDRNLKLVVIQAERPSPNADQFVQARRLVDCLRAASGGLQCL